VQERKSLRWFLFVLLLAVTINTAVVVQAAQPQAAPSAEVTAFDLIIAMNTLRVSYGLPALVEDPIINAVARSTAENMAANQMSWHIGNVSGRLAAAGYGGGSTVWATENFAVGNLSIDEIMVIWSDDWHRRDHGNLVRRLAYDPGCQSSLLQYRRGCSQGNEWPELLRLTSRLHSCKVLR